MTGDDGQILARHGEVDEISTRLNAEHKNLDAMTVELDRLLKKAHWVSQSNQGFQQIMAKYNLHMSELHAELNRLAAALAGSGGTGGSLDQADRQAAGFFTEFA